MRIEVGYGLEGSLPDSVAQRILHNDIAPLLKQKNYDGAVAAGVHAIEQATRGEYKGTGTLPQIGDIGNLIANNIWTIIVVGLLLFQWLGAILGRSKSWWAGGIIGATGGLGIGWILSLGLIITLPIVITLAIFGLIFDFLVSSAYGSARLHGSTPPWWAGGSSGGGFGSSSSGGFGGFGGGGSGGGGASGGW